MLFHLVPLDDSLDPRAPVHPRLSLDEEGFVHCWADETVVLAVADAFYREAAGPLMVLMIDEDLLRAEVRWEAAEPAPPPGVPYTPPSRTSYGPIDRTAVTNRRNRHAAPTAPPPRPGYKAVGTPSPTEPLPPPRHPRTLVTARSSRNPGARPDLIAIIALMRDPAGV